MKISGFTYVRNGNDYGYPFVASIKSLLPIVSEFIVVVGDSVDGTREDVEKINDPKIKIIDTIWDEDSRISGKIFAQQANIGLENTTGDWAFHIQADEVLHENAIPIILNQIEKANSMDNIEGLLFPFLHFWGDFNHIRNTRRTHQFEIRAFKKNELIKSYNDSQGFRRFTSVENFKNGEKGEKLVVLNVDTPVFHYSYARNPKLMKKKSNYFHRFWHNDKWLQENTDKSEFDFNDVDKLELFEKSHPQYMKDVIASQDWVFNYDSSKSTISFKDSILYRLEKIFNHRFFANRNYILFKN